MSQPNGPGIVFNERAPAEFNSLEGSRGAPNPLALPELPTAPAPDVAPGPGPIDFGPVPQSKPESDADQAALEAKHGQGETAATQFARGALSALLAPGALLGAHYESMGKLFHSRTVEDFGRSLGRASTGRSALEAFGAVVGAEAEALGLDTEATTVADKARIAVDEQAKAWPLLSTVSQMGGALTFGLATGGASGGVKEIGARGLAALGAYEGAATGAQAAYDVDAPLTEVWTSAIVGGTIGAGLGAASTLPGKAISKLRGGKSGGLAKAFGEGGLLGEIAEERATKAVGMRGPEMRRLGVQRAKQIGADILDAHLDDGTPVLPRNPLEAARMDQSELTERLTTAMQQQGEKLGTLRQSVSKFIDESAPELRPSMARLAERFESEVIAPLDKVASPGAAAQANEARDFIRSLAAKHGDDMSLEDLFQERLAVDRFDAKFNAKAPEVMNDVRRVMENHIETTLELGAKRAGMENNYGELKRMFGSLKEATTASAKASGTELGNRWLSLSDNMVGMATIAGDLASGGGLSVVKGALAGVGHKILREHGSAVVASLLNRFRRVPVKLNVAEVGGHEAQDAMTHILRARKFIEETASKAGPNPQVGAVASNTAEDVASAELVRLAGKFEPTEWASAARAPSPLARVLYRSPILDTVSNDLAQTVEKSAALRPSLDFEVNPAKLARLTKDADGPQAIGLVQQRVRELADSYTPIAQGIDEAFGQTAPDVIQAARLMPVLEGSLARLETADVAGAMAEAHALSRVLSKAGAETDGRSLALMLGDDSFGRAGKLYQQMTAAPSDTLRELADPVKLRDALRTLELRGELSQQIVAEHTSTLAAYEARKALTGEPIPVDVKKQMQAIEALWTRGEESVTLDGSRLGRIVDALDNTTESKVASKVPAVPEGQQVQEVAKAALEPIATAVKRGSRTGRAIALGAIKAAEQLTPKEQFAQYERRLETLAQATVQPDTDERTAAINQAPSGARVAVTQAASQKVATLLKDMPKPKTDIHGTAYDSLSSEDIRLGNAMWEATMEPMSVFQDFARGDLDPDKVAYAWKQYPGLQKVAQLGVLDILQSQMTPEERSAVPDSMLTQLDFMLGFNGGLQGSVSFEFSQRMTQAFEASQKDSATPSPPNRGLSLPTSKPTMTQRLAGAQ